MPGELKNLTSDSARLRDFRFSLVTVLESEAGFLFLTAEVQSLNGLFKAVGIGAFHCAVQAGLAEKYDSRALRCAVLSGVWHRVELRRLARGGWMHPSCRRIRVSHGQCRGW